MRLGRILFAFLSSSSTRALAITSYSACTQALNNRIVGVKGNGQSIGSINQLAGRWAAKEAVVKALGIGGV